MKKLLAMVLCVVMVLSFSATAFAAGTTGGVAQTYNPDRTPKFADKSVAQKAVTDIGKDMKAMYFAIAADETVFGAAQSIYNMTDSLAKELLKDTEKVKIGGVDVYQEDLIDNVRKGLNHVIGNEIANYMNDRVTAYTNTAGNIQPEKYLNTFVKALNSTLGSAKAQKNIEAIVYGLAAISLQKSVNDRADDLYDAIVDWDHWNEFHWGAIQDPDGAYATTWLPTQVGTDTVLIPTGSTTLVTPGVPVASGDAGLAYSILAGQLN